MLYPTPFSQFAPAQRAPAVKLKEQVDTFANEALLNRLFSGVPEIFLIVTEQRQIVFANHAMLNLLDMQENVTLYGLRPGEAFDCVHASKNMGGCGTTEACKVCGAAQAITC